MGFRRKSGCEREMKQYTALILISSSFCMLQLRTPNNGRTNNVYIVERFFGGSFINELWDCKNSLKLNIVFYLHIALCEFTEVKKEIKRYANRILSVITPILLDRKISNYLISLGYMKPVSNQRIYAHLSIIKKVLCLLNCILHIQKHLKDCKSGVNECPC